MKVIFLDMDGVLNNAASMKARARKEVDGGIFTVDKDCVKRLRGVVDRTGAKIVVSSSWRLDHDTETGDGYHFETRTIGTSSKRVRGALAWAGWEDPPIIGCTPSLSWKPGTESIYVSTKRGTEIKAWLDDYDFKRQVPNALPATAPVERYAILDDDDDMLDEQKAFFVHTDFEGGLLDHHAVVLERILGGGRR